MIPFEVLWSCVYLIAIIIDALTCNKRHKIAAGQGVANLNYFIYCWVFTW